jgi:hypothetical protein
LKVWQPEENADYKQDKMLNIHILILSSFHHYDKQKKTWRETRMVWWIQLQLGNSHKANCDHQSANHFFTVLFRFMALWLSVYVIIWHHLTLCDIWSTMPWGVRWRPAKIVKKYFYYTCAPFNYVFDARYWMLNILQRPWS